MFQVFILEVITSLVRFIPTYYIFFEATIGVCLWSPSICVCWWCIVNQLICASWFSILSHCWIYHFWKFSGWILESLMHNFISSDGLTSFIICTPLIFLSCLVCSRWYHLLLFPYLSFLPLTPPSSPLLQPSFFGII